MGNKRIVGRCRPRREKNIVHTVYICSPYAGDVEKNVEAAKKYARFVYEHDCMPVISHLMYPQFLNDENPKERKDALEMGRMLMGWCQEVWVFGETISEGMKAEIEEAEFWGQCVKYFTSNCEEIPPQGEEASLDIPF